MSFFSRALVVLGVLGGLGYGSYAFGKYVLSAHLFGPNGAKIGAPQAASANGTLETPPQVDVEMMPADGSPPAPSTAARRRTARASSDSNNDILPPRPADDTSDVDVTPSDRGDATPSYNSDNSDEERPRRRRRKRRRMVEDATRTNSERTTSQSAGDLGTSTRENTARAINRDDSTSSDSNPSPRTEVQAPAPQIEAPRSDASSTLGGPSANDSSPRSSEPAPRIPVDNDNSGNDEPRRRRRERRTVERTRTRERELTAPSAPREAPHVPSRSNESPVPVPENNAGESPVPVPG